ncbi:MAG: sulfate adenylyltransferase subunit 1 [Gaiellales bacterium]
MAYETPLLRVVAVGSVDDGKSTLIGRLLHDTGHLTKDQVEAIEEASRKRGRKGVDLALLTDGLRAEREQGITIDVAYRSFEANGRRILLGDAPGHEQYTRNMVTASAGADVAILLIDAKNGILPQTRRHLALCAMLGVSDVIACVNKLDLVGYDEGRFDEVAGELRATAAAVGVESLIAIPLSALNGVNVVERSDQTPWYDGPSVLEVLHDLDPPIAEEAFRMPVQWVVRHDDGVADIRGLAGRIESGTVAVGDEVVAMPSGVVSRIAAIDVVGTVVETAAAPLSVTLHLEDDVDVSRGDVIALAADAPAPVTRFTATVAWLDEQPLTAPARLEAKAGSRAVPVIVEELLERLELETMDRVPADALGANDIGVISVLAASPLVLEPYSSNRALGSLILIDPASNRTVAAVLVDRLLIEA